MSTEASMPIFSYLSVIAIAISMVSLGLHAYLAFRDRAQLSAACSYLCSFEHMTDAVSIHVVNAGRRPLTIRRLVVESDSGGQFKHKFQRADGRALRLVESEDVEIILDSTNSEIAKWLDSKIFKAYIEDSKGKCHRVEGLVTILNENAQHLRNV